MGRGASGETYAIHFVGGGFDGKIIHVDAMPATTVAMDRELYRLECRIGARGYRYAFMHRH